jgi:carbamoylphosphate synthase large subunit
MTFTAPLVVAHGGAFAARYVPLVPHVVFVAPYAMPATVRFVRAVAALPDIQVVVISSDPATSFGDAPIAGHWHLADCLDIDGLTAAVAAVRDRIGGVDRLLGILENLQVQLGEVRWRLGIQGIGPDVADNFRNKARMKAVFDAAGVPCARSRRVASGPEAISFASDVGYPFVAKPLAGAGARNTFRVDSDARLGEWLATSPPSDAAPMLLEEFVTGQEHSFDSVLLDGEMVWHSISRYLPSPLDVLEHPWIQWCVLLPRRIDDQADIVDVAGRALAALGLSEGLSHMEWFRRPDGSIAVSEVGARPPGSQFMTLMSYAHGTDLYAAWARLAVGGGFDPPTRSYACGGAYLRAQGAGRMIVGIGGLDRVSEATRSRVVEVSLPLARAAPTGTYDGDGYVVVRDPDTAAVEAALQEIVSTVRVEVA